jgi:hypothetical protein
MKNKFLILIVLFLIAIPRLHAEVEVKALQGEWLVLDIINLKTGEKANGKFGEMGSYVKFRFKNKTLAVTTTPFDRGLKQSFVIYGMQIKLLVPDFIRESLPETEYEVVNISDELLTFQTESIDNIKIEYHLKKITPSNPQITKFEYEPIILKRIDYARVMDNSVSINNFKMNSHFYPNPISKNPIPLGDELSHRIKYPKDYPVDQISDEMTVKVVLDSKGKVKNVQMIKGVDDTIDISIVQYLKKTKWDPVNIPEDTEIEMFFRFNFLYMKAKLI